MTTSDIAAILTGERMLTKYTGGLEPPSRDEIARLASHLYETAGAGVRLWPSHLHTGRRTSQGPGRRRGLVE